ncbi:hypothetical protein EYF80_014216 [Liparis tanakae]|uniref:Uncharacterized protein n=1 Tax=Liparis tanakae TaxID=230148 RepID=A0A4Z2ICC7_9TELE|nr:hypothetical protein EYF80_014216 [Liparis tanakae]
MIGCPKQDALTPRDSNAEVLGQQPALTGKQMQEEESGQTADGCRLHDGASAHFAHFTLNCSFYESSVDCWLIANQPEQLADYQSASNRGLIGDNTPTAATLPLSDFFGGTAMTCGATQESDLPELRDYRLKVEIFQSLVVVLGRGSECERAAIGPRVRISLLSTLVGNFRHSADASAVLRLHCQGQRYHTSLRRHKDKEVAGESSKWAAEEEQGEEKGGKREKTWGVPRLGLAKKTRHQTAEMLQMVRPMARTTRSATRWLSQRTNRKPAITSTLHRQYITLFSSSP